MHYDKNKLNIINKQFWNEKTSADVSFEWRKFYWTFRINSMKDYFIYVLEKVQNGLTIFRELIVSRSWQVLNVLLKVLDSYRVFMFRMPDLIVGKDVRASLSKGQNRCRESARALFRSVDFSRVPHNRLAGNISLCTWSETCSPTRGSKLSGKRETSSLAFLTSS